MSTAIPASLVRCEATGLREKTSRREQASVLDSIRTGTDSAGASTAILAVARLRPAVDCPQYQLAITPLSVKVTGIGLSI